MLSASSLFWGQHECTSTRARGRDGGIGTWGMLQNEAWRLEIAVANRPDHLLRGYQGRCERQRLHTKPKVVKRKFVDQDAADAATAFVANVDAAAAAANANANAATPATPPDGRAGAASSPGGEKRPPAPSSGGKSGGGKGRGAGGARKGVGKA